MPFWTYMLHCADRTFYVGHTEDLAKRVWQHEQGLVPGYTQRRRPVTLVWSQEFEDRDAARMVEDRLKGWGRLKKLALIRGDSSAISQLARKKEAASTSSASRSWAHEVSLQPHLDVLPSNAFWLRARMRLSENSLLIVFRLAGDVASLSIPQQRTAVRRDELWRYTCFECFVRSKDEEYFEFNFSPSSDWAFYRFDEYRAGMSSPALNAPTIRSLLDARTLELSARVELSMNPTRIGLAAVLEEKSGRKSYWALRHPPGPPDFHHPDCFALELPPPA